MKIEFNEKTEIIIRPAETKIVPERIINIPVKKRLVNEITVLSMIDEPTFKKVTVKTKEAGNIILWKETEYDEVGQWTDDDVINRLKELLLPEEEEENSEEEE